MARPKLGRLTAGGGRRMIAAAALVVAVVVVVVIVVDAGSSPSSGNAAGAATNSGAATVQRRNLTETDTESGTLSYSDPQTVYARQSGTITWLPAVGDEIKPGQTLYKVDGQPVVLMSGNTPAYRTLSPGISDGPDVLQLNRNLVRLGFNADGIVVDDVWQAGTTLGVEQFQESLGETATGTLSLGQIVFLPGPQLISTVNGTLGAAASIEVTTPRPEFVSLDTCPTTTSSSTTTSSETTSTSTSPCTSTAPGTNRGSHRHHRHKSSTRTLAALLALLRAEVAQLRAEHNSPSSNQGNSGSGKSHSGKSNSGKENSGKSSSSDSSSSDHSSNNDGSSGSSGGAGQEILQTTSTQLVVTVDLDASLQSEASVGEHVQVEMPSGRFVEGKVTAVSSVAQSSSNSGSGSSGNGGGGGGNGSGSGNGNGSGGSSSTIPVTITLHGHQSTAGLDQAAVSVNFVKQRAGNVLSVPVTALVATSGTTYAVQEAAAPHKLIPVTTGLFAAGYVQISGPGVYSGLQVTDSQG